MFSSLC